MKSYRHFPLSKLPKVGISILFSHQTKVTVFLLRQHTTELKKSIAPLTLFCSIF